MKVRVKARRAFEQARTKDDKRQFCFEIASCGLCQHLQKTQYSPVDLGSPQTRLNSSGPKSKQAKHYARDCSWFEPPKPPDKVLYWISQISTDGRVYPSFNFLARKFRIVTLRVISGQGLPEFRASANCQIVKISQNFRCA